MARCPHLPAPPHLSNGELDEEKGATWSSMKKKVAIDISRKKRGCKTKK
jgi:hypothetical protein